MIAHTRAPAATSSRGFGRMWLAAAVSFLGDGVREAALPLLAATLTRDPLGVAAVFFAGRLPWLLLSLVSGALADRWDRRRVIVTVDVLRAAVMGVLAVGVVADQITIAGLVVISFVLASGQTLYDNAVHAFVPLLVADTDLERANGRLEAAAQSGREFAGPAFGGLLFAAATALPFGVDAASFALAALLVLSISASAAPRDPAAGPARLRAEIAEGLVWLRGSGVVLRYSLIAAGVNFALVGALAVLVLFAQQVLGLPAAGYGVFLAVTAVGGLAGSLIASALALRFGLAATLTAAVAAAALAQAGTGATSSVPVATAWQVLLMFAGGVYTVLTISLRQRLVPDRLRGRVNGASRLLTHGMSAVGALAGGYVARAWGLRAPFLGGAVLLLLLAVATARTGRLLREERAG